MTSKPHICFGLWTGAVVTSVWQMKDIGFMTPMNIGIALVGTLAGSLFPDIDAPGSPASRTLPFIAKPIQRRFAHRGAVHSLIGISISSGVLLYISDWLGSFFPISENASTILAVFFLMAAIGHLCCDTLTVSGIKWFWPFERAIVFHTAPSYRIRTGDPREKYYTIFFLLLFVCWLPILKAGGAGRSISKAFKNFQMARDDYVKAGKRIRQLLDETGFAIES